MSIDASALTSINDAIASYSSKNTSSTTNTSTEDYISTITKAGAEVVQESRYKQAFEEKLKAATGSDEVEISDEGIKALQQYNLTGKVSSDESDSNSTSNTESSTASTDPSYTYDYVTMKQQREQNLAAIEKEVAEKYGSSTESSEDEEESETESEQTPNLNSEPPRESPPLGMPPMHGMPPPEENAQSQTDPHGVSSASDETSEDTSGQSDTTVSGADEMSESVSLTDA